MEHVAFEDVEPMTFGDGTTRQELAAPLGATHLAINRYRIASGDALPGGLHAHMDQAELFVVIDGTVTFETFDGPVSVGPNEAIRFAPGEFQSGQNPGNTPVEVLAIGAPKETADVRIPVECPSCGHGDLRLETAPDGLTFGCPECRVTHDPAPCPDCGADDLRVGLAEDRDTEVRCQACEARFDRPPLLD